MTIQEQVIYVISNIFLIYVITRFLDVFLDKRKKNMKLFILTGIIFWLINSTCYIFFRKPAISLISSITGLFIVALFSYKDKMWKKLLAVFSVLVMTVMIEEVTGLITGYDQDNLSLLTHILTVLFIFLAQIIIEKVWDFKEKTDFPQSCYYCMLLPSVFSVVIIVLLLKIESEYRNTVFMSIVSVVILLLDILMLYFFDKIFSFYNEIWEKRFLEEKVEMYENQLDIIKQSREKEHALRHDLKNHLFLLAQYENSGKREEVLDYIEKMNQFMAVKEEIVNTGNEQADAILNYMLEKARKQGAELDIRVNIPKTEFLESFDLNVLLSNLLENATEALESCPKKILQFVMELDKGILYIKTGNSFDGQVRRDENRYITRKENKERHGTGLKNVQKVVEKYGGTIEFKQDDAMFYVEVILYMK